MRPTSSDATNVPDFNSTVCELPHESKEYVYFNDTVDTIQIDTYMFCIIRMFVFPVVSQIFDLIVCK